MKSNLDKQLRLGSSLAAMALSAFVLPLWAQEQAPAEAASSALSPPAANAAADQPATADIVVTGSLIARPNNVAVSPIVTVSDELVQQSGQITLEDSLHQLPACAGSNRIM